MLLYTFKPGDLIVASQINHNFQEIAKVIGRDSSAASLALPGRVSIGPNRMGTISSYTDVAEHNVRYLHIGWNAEETLQDDRVAVQRKAVGAGIGSAALRVSGLGFSVLGTKRDTGDLNAQLDTLFSVRTNNVAYLNPKLSFVTDESPDSIADYRLTFKPLSQAVEIVSKANTRDNLVLQFDCASLISKVPQFNGGNFHGVEVSVSAQTGNEQAEVAVFGNGLSKYTGLVTTLKRNEPDTARGCCVFKRGSDGDQILVMTATHNLVSLVVRIVGLWR